MLQVRALGRRVRMLAVVAMAVGCVAPASALADGPGAGAPWVASLGDSAISGEAGRWAGNTNGSSSRVDALGSSAYRDNATGTAEAISGCHRSKSAEVHIGVASSINLACSGARSATHFDGSTFKPGLDFYSDSSGRQGQALALREFAKTHNVRAVVVLIGANDYGFADIVQTCVEDWLTSPSWLKNYCQDDSNIRAMFTAANVSAVTARVRQAYANVQLAMQQAGYSASQWTLFAQTYSSPLPDGSGFRYPETGFTRQTIGGCGTWNRDADWANGSVVATLDNTTVNATAGHGREAARHARRAGRPPAVRAHGRPARGARDRHVAVAGRRGPDRVGQPDPHRDDDHRALPAPGGRAPELLGPAGAAQLLPPGLHEGRRGQVYLARRPEHARRAEHDAWVKASRGRAGGRFPGCAY